MGAERLKVDFHNQIKVLCNDLYDQTGMSSLEPKGNRKAKRTVKGSLRVLILDLYVKWLKDPSPSIGFSKTMIRCLKRSQLSFRRKSDWTRIIMRLCNMFSD